MDIQSLPYTNLPLHFLVDWILELYSIIRGRENERESEKRRDGGVTMQVNLSFQQVT